MPKSISFAFFGTGPLAESVLASLVREGYIPGLVITKPDKRQGRHMHLTPQNIKVWCEMKNISVIQPEDLGELENNSPLLTGTFDVFVVASYGKMIPPPILEKARLGALNVHPSLLPLYRGPSPIESALLDGLTQTGVSIIKLDNEMDHGPILSQTAFSIDPRETAGTLEVTSGQIGGNMLADALPHYVEGTLVPKLQDDSKATYCKKIEKSMGEARLNDEAVSFRAKYRALTPWPGVYFFIDHLGEKLRIKIKEIDLLSEVNEEDKAKDIILTVIPEGKHAMDFESFKRGYMPH